jgi:HAD superfamily hydrolase (TIGR01509 family)
MLRAIFFDFNGVILDDEEYHYLSLQKVLEEEGVSITREAYYQDCLGFGDVECFEWGIKTPESIRKAGGMEELVRRKSVYYERLLQKEAPFFPGVCELIREAASGYPLGVASMALRQEIDLALEKAGLTQLIPVIVSGEDVSRPKPAPDVYEVALVQMNLSLSRDNGRNKIVPGECLVIEDSIPGIRSARSAGMHVLGVAHTMDQAELDEADWTVPSLEGLSVQDLEAFMADNGP